MWVHEGNVKSPDLVTENLPKSDGPLRTAHLWGPIAALASIGSLAIVRRATGAAGTGCVQYSRIMSTDSRQRIARIQDAIRSEERRLRAVHGWLAHQDRLGLACFVGALVAWALVTWAWTMGLPSPVAVLLIALAISILHELEHDLIHGLYLRRRPAVQNLLFLGIFLAKMSMDPWSRKRLHLRHHRVSGQPIDIEERLIGLGLPLGPRRLALTLIPAFSALVLPGLVRDLKAFREQHPRTKPRERLAPWRRLMRLVSLGFALLPFFAAWAALRGEAWALPLLVLYVLPNLLRHASIAFMSSMSHYYEDIEPNDVFEQNQVLDHWMFWPLQLFCFNFGATHILHHYVVQQPFYLRHMVAPGVLEALLAEGVRRNDLGTVPRANRYRLDG